MPLLSVLTAGIGESPEFVAEAGESLAGQELPDGWELEWVVQEDGPNPDLATIVERFPYTKYEANGQWLGISATRNLALSRLEGSVLYVLDCDDLILPGGLGAIARVFEDHPHIHWVATQADNLMPDGTRVSFPPISPVGRVEAGAVNDFILARDYGPFLPHGTAMRTATVRALGGWVATPHGEDIALLAAVSELAPGHYMPEVTWLYRQHDRQTSRRPTWLSFRPLSASLTRQRINALRVVDLRLEGF